MITNRIRSEIDDRHAMRDPIRRIRTNHVHQIDLDEARAHVNTLVKTRIPQLFSTAAGLNGHVMQLQQELNRYKISKMEGCRADEVTHLMEMLYFLKGSVIKAKNASTIPLPNNLFLEFPLISNRLKI